MWISFGDDSCCSKLCLSDVRFISTQVRECVCSWLTQCELCQFCLNQLELNSCCSAQCVLCRRQSGHQGLVVVVLSLVISSSCARDCVFMIRDMLRIMAQENLTCSSRPTIFFKFLHFSTFFHHVHHFSSFSSAFHHVSSFFSCSSVFFIFSSFFFFCVSCFFLSSLSFIFAFFNYSFFSFFLFFSFSFFFLFSSFSPFFFIFFGSFQFSSVVIIFHIFHHFSKDFFILFHFHSVSILLHCSSFVEGFLHFVNFFDCVFFCCFSSCFMFSIFVFFFCFLKSSEQTPKPAKIVQKFLL